MAANTRKGCVWRETAPPRAAGLEESVTGNHRVLSSIGTAGILSPEPFTLGQAAPGRAQVGHTEYTQDMHGEHRTHETHRGKIGHTTKDTQDIYRGHSRTQQNKQETQDTWETLEEHNT